MGVWEQKINRGELPDFCKEQKHECVCLCVAAGWALPVEPVICVAGKWERVIAAEVIAGISILKEPKRYI